MKRTILARATFTALISCALVRDWLRAWADEREERPMSDALETLAMVIQGADEYTEHVGDGSWSERIADAVVAFLTSDEAVDRAARSAHENPHPWQVASGDWGAAGHEIREAFIAQQRAAILAALGVESLPLDPVSEAELICGDYPAPCNHNPAHKKGAE